ncbi:MAG: tudor domain-containing protein [Sandaracinus sp.]
MYAPGSDVLAPWLNDPNLYPAVVVSVDAGGIAHVAYWEGDVANIPVGQLRPAHYQPGDPVEANWKNRGQYWPGIILARIGGAVQIQYASDGTIEWTTFAKCRVKAQPAGAWA